MSGQHLIEGYAYFAGTLMPPSSLGRNAMGIYIEVMSVLSATCLRGHGLPMVYEAGLDEATAATPKGVQEQLGWINRTVAGARVVIANLDAPSAELSSTLHYAMIHAVPALLIHSGTGATPPAAYARYVKPAELIGFSPAQDHWQAALAKAINDRLQDFSHETAKCIDRGT